MVRIRNRGRESRHAQAAFLYSLPVMRHLSSFYLREQVMAKSKKKAETIFLVCQETGDYNYTLRRKPGGERLELMKYSPRLRKHTKHVEKKK